MVSGLADTYADCDDPLTAIVACKLIPDDGLT